MGYDEPSSKPSGSANQNPQPPSRKRKSGPARFLILGGVLAAVIYTAMNFDSSNPAGIAGKFVSDISGLVSGGTPGAGGGRGGRGGRGGPPPPVRVAAATTKDVPVVVRTIGTVLANSVVLIKPQVDGPLLSVHFREGQMVKKGDLLFRIDPAPFEAALRQAEATAQRDRAQQASAQADADRAVMLAERGIVSAQQRDQLVASAKAIAATIEGDEAAIERAKLNLGYTTIVSPIDGKTGPYIVHPGNQVRAADAAGLITITQIQPVKITFNLPQANLPRLQDRLRENSLSAEITLRNDLAAAASQVSATKEMSIPVKIDFIGNTVDQRTGTIELRATFANPDLRFVPGELVDVGVTLETLKNAVVVPHEAINAGQDGTFVFVVGEDGKADTRPVKVVYEDQTIAALGSGIKDGDRTVIDGQLRLNPGTAVSIVGDNPGSDAVAAQPNGGGAGRNGNGRGGRGGRGGRNGAGEGG